MIESEQRRSAAVHLRLYGLQSFPWWNTLRPELTPDWRDLGNEPEVDEYLRRQTLSARDYADFKQRLARDFPEEPFLCFASAIISRAWRRIIDPAADRGR